MKNSPTKRLWKWLAGGIAVLFGLVLIINGILAGRAEQALRSRLAAIRASGDPASIAELAPAILPDDENAAAVLKAIAPRLKEFSREHAGFYDSQLGKEYDAARDRGEPATPAQIEAMRAILSRYADVEEAIADAAACDDYASLMDFSLGHARFINDLMNRASNDRAPARFLAWRMEVLLAEGQHEQALETGMQALRLARLYENEPAVVSFMLAMAQRATVTPQLYDALAAGPVSPELHAALDDELARQDTPLRLQHALKTERAVAAGWSDDQMIGSYRILYHTIGWPLKSYQSGGLDASNECLALAALPWHEASKKLGPKNSSSPSDHGVMADLLIPALRAVFEANARGLVLARTLRIHNALRRFAEEHGREASGLEELSLPVDATLDPYSGEPLKLKHTEDGWVIYSVMENGVDEDGDFKGLQDYGVAPAKRRLTE